MKARKVGREMIEKCLIILMSIVPAIAWTNGLQASGQQKNADLSGVRLTVVSQQWLPEEPPAPVDPNSDVFEIVKDNLSVRFRLANESKENVYYLASIHDDEPRPTGYILYRQVGEKEWKATTPDRGRVGSFTGGGYRWVLLSPGTAVEFEVSDLSTRKGEHAASVLVNGSPDHEGRMEVISDPYQPLCRSVKESSARRQR